MSQTDTFIVKGLAGKKTLRGEVKIKGAKNAVLPALSASILFDSAIELRNVSDTADIGKMEDIIVGLGAKVDDEITGSRGSIRIDASKLSSTDLDRDASSSMRASVFATGPILARYGKVSFPSPGGCVIGARPIDRFIEAYKKMGASVAEEEGFFRITASKGGLKGAEIFFPIQTVGGTETLMMAAVLAKGTTVLRNCAMEPEVESIAQWLNECGARIEGAGTTTITIHGTKPLKPKPYHAVPDRIETGSFVFLGALCADDLLISDCEPRHVESITSLLMNAGVPISIGKDSIHIRGNANLKNASFKSANITTHEYPGFPTDVQPIAAVFMSQVTGDSVIFETIFEGRFKYADDLSKLESDVTVMNPREIMVKGPSALKALPAGEELTAHDIRAGFAVVLAALCAEGTSVVNNVQLIDRGYESLEKTLASLGADARRVSAEEVMD